MLTKDQRFVAAQAANKLRADKYKWARGRCALTITGKPVEIEADEAAAFDIFGLIDRANFDAGFVAAKISPIFEELKKAVVFCRIGDMTAANLQQWNDSPRTMYADVLLALDIVARGDISGTNDVQYAREAAE